jgi:hypothetical protein
MPHVGKGANHAATASVPQIGGGTHQGWAICLSMRTITMAQTINRTAVSQSINAPLGEVGGRPIASPSEPAPSRSIGMAGGSRSLASSVNNRSVQ